MDTSEHKLHAMTVSILRVASLSTSMEVQWEIASTGHRSSIWLYLYRSEERRSRSVLQLQHNAGSRDLCKGMYLALAFTHLSHVSWSKGALATVATLSTVGMSTISGTWNLSNSLHLHRCRASLVWPKLPDIPFSLSSGLENPCVVRLWRKSFEVTTP